MPATITGSSTGTVGLVNSGTAQNSTSGTAITFTGIPAGVKRITVMFNGVSTSGTSHPILRIGSGSIDTTSYTATSSLTYGVNSASVSSTVGFDIYSDVASSLLSGAIILYNVSGNIWVANGNLSVYGQNACSQVVGTKTLAGTLDRVQLTTVNGTDTFDAGSINILYE